MIHPLWLSKDWKNAGEEDIISALLNAPQHLDPEDMVQIQRHHPQAKTKYLNLFHSGQIPHWCKIINHIS